MAKFLSMGVFATAFLAAVLIASSPLSAAKGGRGGGGGAHAGGGHGGGGGARVGGGGGARFAGARTAGPRFSGGGRRFGGGRPAVSRQFARPGRFNRAVAGRGNSNRFVNSNVQQNASQSLRSNNPNAIAQNARSNSVRNALRARAVAGALRNRNGLRNPNARAAIASNAALAGWRNGGGRGWWRHGHGGYGWVGPLFWPFAYYDVYGYTLWGYGYDPSFWDYGYNDIYAGMFTPYGYDDLAGYLPQGSGSRSATTQSASSSSPSLNDDDAQLSQMCGDDSRDIAGLPIDRIQQSIQPTEEQRVALDDLSNASVSAAQKIRAACPGEAALTAPKRLAAMQTRVEAMLDAVRTIQPPLVTFYGLLNDEQKVRLNALGVQQNGTSPSARDTSSDNRQGCNAPGNIQWPADEITRKVRPTEAQKASLAALQDATSKAAESLAASCQPEGSLTPPARLAAADKRLDSLLQSVTGVRVALDDFYASLNDEQKAQFEAVGQERDTTVGQAAASEQRSDSRPRYRRRGFGSVEGMIRHFIAIAR